MSVAVPAVAPGPSEGCPPPLRCRDVWRNVQDTADVWERTTPRGATVSGWTMGHGPTVVFLSPFGGARDLFALVAWLMRDELRPLSRHDFLPAADAEASKRVQAVLALFGPVPRDVFTGARAPRHSQRRVELTAQELRLLQDADLSGSPAARDGDEATLL